MFRGPSLIFVFMAKDASDQPKERSKLFDKFKLVVVNDSTFEEVYSQSLSRLNAYSIIVFFVALIALFTFVLTATTPLRYLIPGIESAEVQREVLRLAQRTDSIYQVMERDKRYISQLGGVVRGEVSYDDLPKDSLILDQTLVLSDAALEAQKNVAMLALEREVRREDQYNPLISEDSFENLMFFVPVEGVVSQNYDPRLGHLATDIAARTGAAVKAVADATVIHAEWSSDTGYNLILIHPNNMLSVYKHNGELFKKQGDAVRAGEVVALVGDTGELSTGAHLHFELWRNGKPVDPQNYIDF